MINDSYLNWCARGGVTQSIFSAMGRKNVHGNHYYWHAKSALRTVPGCRLPWGSGEVGDLLQGCGRVRDTPAETSERGARQNARSGLAEPVTCGGIRLSRSVGLFQNCRAIRGIDWTRMTDSAPPPPATRLVVPWSRPEPQPPTASCPYLAPELPALQSSPAQTSSFPTWTVHRRARPWISSRRRPYPVRRHLPILPFPSRFASLAGAEVGAQSPTRTALLSTPVCTLQCLGSSTRWDTSDHFFLESTPSPFAQHCPLSNHLPHRR
jgi:hypothetical protein